MTTTHINGNVKMNNMKDKLINQLFIGKVTELIGTDKTIELLKECKETFKDFEDKKSFEDLVRPLMRYISEYHNPHTKVFVTLTNAELIEAIQGTGEILDYLE